MRHHQSFIKDAAIRFFEEPSYAVGHWPLVAPSEPVEERDSFIKMSLAGRSREAIRRLSPVISGRRPRAARNPDRFKPDQE